MRIKWSGLAMLCGLIFLIVAGVFAASKQNPFPAWLTPEPCKNEMMPVLQEARKGATGTRKSLNRLFYQVNHYANTPNHPLYCLMLAEGLYDEGELEAAKAVYEKMLTIPGKAPYPVSPQSRIPNRERLEMEANLGLFKLASSRRDIETMDALLGRMSSASWTNWDSLRIAEGYFSCGATGLASKIHVSADGLTPPQKLRLAFFWKALHGDGEKNRALYALLSELDKLPVEKPQDAKFNGPVVRQAQTLRELKIPALGKLKDGEYKGTAPGFLGPIRVTVRVEDGAVSRIEVEHKDDRPFSCAKTVPARIRKQKSLPVEIVSGATITSMGIELAVAAALADAL